MLDRACVTIYCIKIMKYLTYSDDYICSFNLLFKFRQNYVGKQGEDK